MLQLGPLLFAAPWVLAALAALPVLWWLMRVTPPAPRLVAFPPVRLLMRLRPREETPARTPLWLILLRLLLAALVIFAFAHPLLNPQPRLLGSGPLVLVIDDGWAAARQWAERKGLIDRLLDRAERARRPVAVLTTARPPDGGPLRVAGLMRVDEARRLIGALAPKPWPTDRAAATAAIEGFATEGTANVAWLSDGLGDGTETALGERLQRLGQLKIYAAGAAGLPHVIRPPSTAGPVMVVPILRVGTEGPALVRLRGIGNAGRVAAIETVRFEPGQDRAEAQIELPAELRNELVRLEIENEDGAGAVFLLDERWRRRPVGVASGDVSEAAQPLLGDIYYLDRALQPYSEVRTGTVTELLQRELAVLALADIGRLSESEATQLGAWIERGGVVIRFAGPRLAGSGKELIPVQLRDGGRALGGVMSWSQPAKLAPFDSDSPFAGLAVPGDVVIQRQVLAEPSAELAKKTWARLVDGTPLVTAERRGRGWLVLVHTTAGSEWSNLPLSGLFVEMLQRIIGLSQGVAGAAGDQPLPPVETLDGFGRLRAPPPTARPIRGSLMTQTPVGPEAPPGYYGREMARQALNLGSSVAALKPLGPLPAGIEAESYAAGREIDLKRWLLLAAVALALADLAIALILRGLLPGLGAARAVSVTLGGGLIALAVAAGPAAAQSGPRAPGIGGPDEFAMRATLETRLAYVVTGQAQIDATSRAGLIGLSAVLARRTAVDAGEPMGVDPDRHDLAFFPMLYWPISPQQPRLTDRAVRQLNGYLRSGGTILFDTREQGGVGFDPLGQGQPAARRLRAVLELLDLPPLTPVPPDHVLTKSFYLLADFPGRWTGGAVWVERRGGRHNDGVSSVVIGAHDWAGAWAVDANGVPQFAVIPGGERQRELAYRFGVNWVMYALTGNYKTDQVHVPEIMRRLGQ